MTENNEYGRCRFLKDWNDWEKSIHEREDQIQRQGWSKTYPFSYIIFDDKEIGIFSSTSDLPYYETRLSRCNCHDFQDRHLPCKHIYALAWELGLIEIFNRPTFNRERLEEVKASANIDSQPEQLKRIESSKSAKCKPKSVDYENQTAVFEGSGLSPYQTTIDTCTCRDYFVRRLPCKHIYRLRRELEKNMSKCAKVHKPEKIVLNDDLSNTKLKGQTFVLTGTIDSFERVEVANIIESSGGKVSSSVSRKTSYLIAGNEPGSKLLKANELGIKVISMDELLEMIK